MVRLFRYLAGKLRCNLQFLRSLSFLFFISLFAVSCSFDQIQDMGASDSDSTGIKNSPMVEGQVLPPDNIKSIQVYRGSRKTAIPAIELGTDEFITLRFDEIDESSRMFRVRVRHRDADWSSSAVMRDFYLSGYREDIITRGSPSGVQDPDYVHYRYRFPNENMRVTMSGNYLLEIRDYESSDVLFSVPFFVHEDAGSTRFSYEELFGLDDRYRVHHQPFVRYRYPDIVQLPTSDLRLFFVQNRFWGRAREADQEDMSESGVYRTYLSRREAFVGTYEFRPLDLRRYDSPRPEAVEIRTETVPPRVVLFRDVVNLDVNPPRRTPSPHGFPRDDERARYVDVRFELEIPDREKTDLPVYVYGPFNNWTINEENRMEYRESTDSWVGRAVMKEGRYDYKYAVVEDGRIDDLRLDDSFASTEQEYTSLIYFRDPRYQADRLLNIQTGASR